ncbi:MAG: DUF362 domain-containing protein [Clostridia bacterium]|nr:DUF362 domain-containing protein [Clostridia bacterium]MBT7123200.1 DUF362 domain-containing protein [Clostridia bacterium]
MCRLYVANGQDAGQMTRQLLEQIEIEQYIGENDSVALKPNLVVAKTFQSGATTNPDICAAVIEYLFERGRRNVSIIESSWVGEGTARAFKVCGYNDLAKKYGVELVDVKKDDMVECEYDGLKVDVSKRALETDYIINLPLIKGHCQTKVTCALKNMKGLISDKEKRRFHALGLSKPIAYLNKMICADFTIADGTCTDTTFEEGGNPTALNTMIAGSDSVLLDTYAAKMLGYCVSDVGYLKIAAEIGVGSSDLHSAQIVHINSEQKNVQVVRNGELEKAKALIRQDSACSACYSNLVSAMISTGADKQVRIGQGFREMTGEFGCGDCTKDFDDYVEGCPPSIEDIEKHLGKA